MSGDRCPSGRFTAFIAGALAGAAFALLTTTKTGRENRRILSNLGEKILDELQERHDDSDRLKEKGQDLMGRGREYLKEKRNALNEAIEAGREAMQKEKEELEKVMDPDFNED